MFFLISLNALFHLQYPTSDNCGETVLPGQSGFPSFGFDKQVIENFSKSGLIQLKRNQQETESEKIQSFHQRLSPHHATRYILPNECVIIRWIITNTLNAPLTNPFANHVLSIDHLKQNNAIYIFCYV